MSSINLIGDFYDSTGNKIAITTEGINLNIENLETIQEGSKEEDNFKNSVSSDKQNAYLQSLRLNEEGITPDFSRDILNYYFIANTSINNLEVSAIPENLNATVTVRGNKNLKNGINYIEIEVVSEDKTQKQIYRIEVTKTDNIDAANSNLENLAIENAVLSPEFDAYQTTYYTVVSNMTENLNVLAIPEKIKAKTEISGANQLKTGNNTVSVKVTAENNMTTKNYIVNVYRRTAEEQEAYEKEQEYQAVKTNALLKNAELEEEKQHNKEENQSDNKNENVNVIIIIGILLSLIIAIYLFFKFYKKRTNK